MYILFELCKKITLFYRNNNIAEWLFGSGVSVAFYPEKILKNNTLILNK